MVELAEIEAFGITDEDLSRTGQGFSAVIGLPLTLKLIEKYRGKSLYVAKNAPAGSDLVQVIGEDAAVRLGEYYGRERINIPMERNLELKIRNMKIIKKYRGGRSVSQLTEDFGIGSRQLWEILAQHKTKKRKGMKR